MFPGRLAELEAQTMQVRPVVSRLLIRGPRVPRRAYVVRLRPTTGMLSAGKCVCKVVRASSVVGV